MLDHDPHALHQLFDGGAEAWLPLLKPTIDSLPDAASFIGPNRDKSIVPVRELTFQALKPNPPERWKVVAFGQNPYPRLASATGIAMFDNTFTNWRDSQFGSVTSIRCLIKAACVWKHQVAADTSVAEVRYLLAEHQVVSPPAWFQALLTQGVLLLNAALTASCDAAISPARHTAFWRPVIERIVDEILKAKQSADPHHQGVVFAWWGNHAKALRKIVEKLQTRYPHVPVKHVDHCNPAAMGDAFCRGNPLGAINDALTCLQMSAVDWLPVAGWDRSSQAADANRMGEFIAKTRELHKLYLERLQGVKDEILQVLPPISGVAALPLMGLADALETLMTSTHGLSLFVQRALQFAREHTSGSLSDQETAALYLYTTESGFYRSLNTALRSPDRGRVAAYLPYLRLLLSALGKLTPYRDSLWRGIGLDLRNRYPIGSTITWWGVSSCTSKVTVAQNFLGSKGPRMLFEVVPSSAVSIRGFSAYTAEDEYVLAPGTQLKVTDLETKPDGLTIVVLEELSEQRLVC